VSIVKTGILMTAVHQNVMACMVKFYYLFTG